MSESKHTPGQMIVNMVEFSANNWMKIRAELMTAISRSPGDGGEVVGVVWGGSDEEQSANAALIAEAFSVAHETGRTPRQMASRLGQLEHVSKELLEALEMIRDADDDCKRDGLPAIPDPARAKIDAAITKAKGEQS